MKQSAHQIIAPERLKEQAYAHLARYNCSAQQLRMVLLRKCRRTLMRHKTIAPAELEAHMTHLAVEVDVVVDHLAARGYLDDARYAEAEIRRLRRQGKGQRYIASWLKQKGVADDAAKAGFAAHADEAPEEASEWGSAIAHAKRRKLGPWRKKPMPQDQEDAMKARQRELGSFARAGFEIGMACRIVDAKADKDLKDMG